MSERCPVHKLKLKFSPKQFQISKLHRIFLLIKEGNGIPNIYCKLQDHTKKIFLKIVILLLPGYINPPRPLTLTACPPPGEVVPQTFFFFTKMTAKNIREITWMP